MVSVLLLVGLAVAVFVGFNIGGSSTGVAFGPAVGSGILTKGTAAVLMVGFAFLGGATVGRNVIETMQTRIVPSESFTLMAAVIVLFFIGMSLLVSNLFGVPASTSMTAVGAIAGLGSARGTLRWDVLGGIVSWWLVAPIVAFWICAVIGRYLYPFLEVRFTVDRSDGPLVRLDRSGAVPTPRLGSGTTRRELLGNVLVIGIACYMAFSAGASNFANAVAPLVGNEAITVNQGIALVAVAIGLGAFTIARRTLDTVGNDLTQLPILAALVVEVVSASIIYFLSSAGIPASLAVSATMSVVGLGWGRATRTTTITEAAEAAVTGDTEGMAPGAAFAESEDRGVPTVGEPAPEAEPEREVAAIGDKQAAELTAADLFDPDTTGRVIVLWLLTPTLSATGSWLVFSFLVV